jgi:mannuronan 5-epimerase
MSRHWIATALFLLVSTLAAAPGEMNGPSPEAEVAGLVQLATEPAVSNQTIFEHARGLWPELRAVRTSPPSTLLTSARSNAALGYSLAPIDLILAQLAFQTGANYHLALREAQSPSGLRVLVLERGSTSLSQLADALVGTQYAGALERTSAGIIARMPLAIWSDATLLLNRGERLILDRSAGAFLLDAGRLVARGATISSSPEPNARQADFRPFVLVALSGSADIRETVFENLGFGQYQNMSGLSFAQGWLYAESTVSILHGNIFLDTGSLSIVEARGAEISGNRFIRSRGPAILIEAGSGVKVSRNVVVGASQSHGIKVTGGASTVVLSDNLMLANGGHGVFADAGTTKLTVEGNLIAGNAGSGIVVTASACVNVAGNTLVENDQKGVSISRSIKVAITDNRIADNGSAGVAVAAQGDGVTELRRNRVSSNRVGIFGVQSGRIDLTGNDLLGQLPRLLAGELVQHTPLLLASMARYETAFSLNSPVKATTVTLLGYSPFELQACLGETN